MLYRVVQMNVAEVPFAPKYCFEWKHFIKKLQPCYPSHVSVFRRFGRFEALNLSIEMN